MLQLQPPGQHPDLRQPKHMDSRGNPNAWTAAMYGRHTRNALNTKELSDVTLRYPLAMTNFESHDTARSEEHTSELQSLVNTLSRLLL